LVDDAREVARAGSVGGVVFTGHRTKQLIKKAELQLGVRHPCELRTQSGAMARKSEMERLIRWAEEVFRDAGVTPAAGQITDMAQTVAWVIISQQFLPFATEHPVQPFIAWFGETRPIGKHVDEETRLRQAAAELEGFDETRDRLITMTREADLARLGPGRGGIYGNTADKLVDDMISQTLTALRPTWTQDIRQEFGVPGSAPAGPTPATAAATTGGGDRWP
jgi:hypothetical protein